MFCNFCGKNFDASDGFEEMHRWGQKLIRCEECVQEQRDEEYDWHNAMTGRGRQARAGKPPHS